MATPQLLKPSIHPLKTLEQLQHPKGRVREKLTCPQAVSLDSTHLGVQLQNPKLPTPSSPNQLLHFQLRGCNGRNGLLDARSDSSVEDLKEMVFQQTGIPAGSQILYLNNQTLLGGKVLREFNLRGITDLLVVHKVWGG